MISDRAPKGAGCERAGAPNPPLAGWEFALVAAAAALALGLGFSKLATPSLWHDEAVQVLVAKSIVETGKALLPSGNPHPVAPVFNTVMAGFIALFGDAEAVVRTPAVLFSAANVLLTFLLLRPLLGRPAAVVSALALAVSPWSVAWSRQARFYAMQQTLYLLTLWAVWNLASRPGRRAAVGFGVGSGAAYLLAIGTSLHSVLFVAPAGAYAFLMGMYERRLKSRWTALCLIAGLAGLATLFFYKRGLPEADAKAIFVNAGLGLELTDRALAPRFYYLHWLSGNLSLGYFILAMVGFVLMLMRRGRRGLFVALAFWAPVIVLTFLIAYRRHRFMYFVFPFYVAAFSYAIVELAGFLRTARRSWLRATIAAAILLFGVRLCWSTIRLVGDSVEVASGAPITLATRHPQWRTPCLYVRDHLDDDIAVITTTYTPTLYYVGRVDDWYPSLFMSWESWETGSEGIKTFEELSAFIALHPKGYFLAEWQRFFYYDFMEDDRAWVEAHMTRIDEAATGDVTLYAWGMDGF